MNWKAFFLPSMCLPSLDNDIIEEESVSLKRGTGRRNMMSNAGKVLEATR